MKARSERTNVVRKTLSWISRKQRDLAYPTDIVALTMKVRARLREREIAHIVQRVVQERKRRALHPDEDIPRELIVKYIRKFVDRPPTRDEVERVAHLLNPTEKAYSSDVTKRHNDSDPANHTSTSSGTSGTSQLTAVHDTTTKEA